MQLSIYTVSLLVGVLINLSCNNKALIAEENLRHETAHFIINYTQYDKNNITSIGDTLEKYYPVITNHFSTGVIAKVEVNFYPDFQSLNNAVKDKVPDLPSWAIGLAISSSQIHMLSPNHANQNFTQMCSNLVHEFAHCVTLSINPRFGNNPRWLWESIAAYEAGQFRDPKRISYMLSHTPPPIDELNNINNTKIYEIGYLLSEYIIDNWGYAKLRELIQNNGQIQLSLNKTNNQFISDWFTYVKAKYSL